MARSNGRARDKHRRSVDEVLEEGPVEAQATPAPAPKGPGRAFYCNLHLSQKEVEMLEVMRTRITSEWEQVQDQEVDRPELVRRILIYAVKTYQARNDQARGQFVAEHMSGGLL